MACIDMDTVLDFHFSWLETTISQAASRPVIQSFSQSAASLCQYVSQSIGVCISLRSADRQVFDRLED